MSESKKILTVVVPTYNRKTIIEITMPELISQINKTDVNLIIVNNGSTDETSKYLENIKSANEKIKIINLRNNIGGDAIVLLALNEVVTEYVYILGDDDLLANKAIDIIIEDLLEHTPIWINYQSNSPSHKRRDITEKLENHIQFLKRIHSWNELLFISNNIYKTEIIGKGLRSFYQITQSGHVLAMIEGIEKNIAKGNYIYSNRLIIQEDSLDPKNNQNSYSLIPFLTNSSMLMDLFSAQSNKEIRRLVKNTRDNWLPLIHIFKIFTIHFHVNKKNVLHTELFIVNAIKTFGLDGVNILTIALLAKMFGGFLYKYAKRNVKR